MKNKVARRTKKKPYEPPKLIEYGSLSQLTLVKGGTSGDGRGKPRSRLSGVRA